MQLAESRGGTEQNQMNQLRKTPKASAACAEQRRRNRRQHLGGWRVRAGEGSTLPCPGMPPAPPNPERPSSLPRTAQIPHLLITH